MVLETRDVSYRDMEESRGDHLLPMQRSNPKKEAWSLGAGFLMGVKVNKITVGLQPCTNR